MSILRSLYKLIKPLTDYVRPRLINLFYPSNLDYAPTGWNTDLNNKEDSAGWNALSVVATEKARWDRFCNLVKGTGPLGFSHEHPDMTSTGNLSFHNVHITYGYVLALAAHQRSELSVLDYGGGLGHYYQLGKALLPGVEIKFHCKEMPRIAETGKLLNPDIQWFTDDSCLNKTYDLVIISSSLQYIEKWQDSLRTISPAAGKYLFLMRIPAIEKAESYVAVQKAYGTKMLHWQFNKNALIKTIEGEGLQLVREFIVGDRPYIKHAPEQFEALSWLFRKK